MQADPAADQRIVRATGEKLGALAKAIEEERE